MTNSKDDTREYLTATAKVDIHAPPKKVWEALTDPRLVKEYFFGVDMKTDWQIGSLITYRGEWEGKKFEDRGTVLEFDPERKIVTNYLPASSGVDDTPENYHIVTYTLKPTKTGTRLTITQDNISSQEKMAHSQKNWDMVLSGMKKMLEG